MKKLSKQLVLVFLLWCCSITASAQALPKVLQAFDSYQRDRYAEKIFVHTDKDTYLSGELVWYKVYCRNSDFLVEDFSKVVYIDILDTQQNFILQAKVALVHGSGSGSFYLPKTIKSGAFKLRAYTNWLKNFGPENFFEKKLNFINLYKENQEPSIKREIPAAMIHFFPEGGNLVDGLTSKVAFKVVGKDGKGIDLNGVIVTEKNDTVARFSTLKFGIGSFLIKPVIGHTYKAIAKSMQQEIIISELPKVKREGFVMSVAQDGNTVNVKLNTNTAVSNAYLVVHNNRQTSFAQQINFNAGVTKISVSLSQLKAGVSSFTLFNNDGFPIAERLFFKRPSKEISFTAASDKGGYATRKNVIVNIAAKDEQAVPIKGDFSMAVYKLDSLNLPPQYDIVSYLWLTSALKGNIESPEYYLSNNNPGANEALDNLLLSQGWRNFKWNEVLNDQKPTLRFLPELNGHLIAGVANNRDGNSVKDKGLYLGIPGKNPQFYAAKLDSNGNFTINAKNFYGNKEIVLLPANEADSLLKIKLLSSFAEQFTKNSYDFDQPSVNALNALKKRSLTVETQNAFIGNKLKVFYGPNMDSLSFYGTPSVTYDLDLYTRFPTMEEVFREYIAQVRVTKHQKQSHMKVIGDPEFLNEDPLVLLDGVPYNDIDLVMALDPLKIKKLAIVKERYFYGGLTLQGILDFSTVNGDAGEQTIDPHALVLDYEGLELQREFYQPVYETEAQGKSRIPDFRDVLYWSPNVILDTLGKSKISFYTADQSGNYIVVIQGISEDGIPVCKYFTFEVKQKE